MSVGAIQEFLFLKSGGIGNRHGSRSQVLLGKGNERILMPLWVKDYRTILANPLDPKTQENCQDFRLNNNRTQDKKWESIIQFVCFIKIQVSNSCFLRKFEMNYKCTCLYKP